MNVLASDARLRRERWVVVRTLLGMAAVMPFLVGLQWYLADGPGLVPLAVAGAATLMSATAALWTTIRHALGPGELSTAPFLLSFLSLTVAAWALSPEGSALVLSASWWGLVAPAVPRAWSAVTGAILLLLPWAHALVSGGETPSPLWVLGGALLAWAMLAGNRVNLRLWHLSREVVAGRRARERSAANEERLRIARDIHDLLGHRLSGIAVRSELAARLAEIAPERAADEMRTVQGEARRALREVRSTVSGYREADPVEELEGIHEVLAAAGIRPTVIGDAREVPEALRSTVSWVLREAVTNVVRHGSGGWCRITLARERGSLIVEVRNDGAPEGESPAGSGILGLTERVAAEGGGLEAGPEGEDVFLLRAVLPAAPPGDTEKGEA